jgi:competence protein ComEC
LSRLRATLIDVAAGDSILIESEDSHGNCSYALIDSNDSTNLQSSRIFLKRHFEKNNLSLPDDKPIFSFVLLSHAHSDHAQGLKTLMREFGTQRFWYPKSVDWSSFSTLIQYATLSSNVQFHQSIDNTKILNPLGDAQMEILWPPHTITPQSAPDENDNSVVLVMTLGNVSFVFTGDAEETVWSQISGRIPANTGFFKVPHHGSVNGTFDNAGNTPWFDSLPQNAVSLGISTHLVPHGHPDQEVTNLFDASQHPYYRTDQHYHVTFETTGNTVDVKYSHI